MIRIEHVDKHFGELHVLKDINLEVTTGQVVVVLGPSGSGKSTLCRAINRLEPVDSGTIAVDGRPLPAEGRELAQLRADVGMVFQSFNLFPYKTVIENVIEGPVIVQGLRSADARAYGLELLNKVGLADKADAYPSKISGGQQQRAAIARALAMRPKAMLFDEPTSSLDPELVGEVLRVMEQVAGEGMTMLVATHEMGFARKVADRVMFLDQGRVLELGTPDELFGRPRHERLRRFLNKVLV